MLWNFLGMTLAGLCFSLSYGCPGKHLVQMGAGITPFAPYAVTTLISTLFTLNFYQKIVIKFDCFCRFLLINFEVKFLEKFSH
ncbi:hypothetical protein [Campylobacter concisus]|uniref:hypothetical protein n=1 Tax=Campylobacter concisus TaxID=199 RepID=UPI001F294558